LPVAALTFFGEPLLGLWTSAETAAPAAHILFVLAPGFLLNVSVAIPYTLALATGNTSIVIRVFSMAFIVYLPMLYFAIVHWGGVGAAIVWLLLNISYLFSLVPLVLRRIIGQTARNWVGRNLLPFLALGALVFGVALAVQETLEWRGHFAILVVCAVASLAYCLLGLRLLDPALRNGLWMLLKSVISLLRGVVELR
jgi:O-antigen/teichoic acid export membrane protein